MSAFIVIHHPSKALGEELATALQLAGFCHTCYKRTARELSSGNMAQMIVLTEPQQFLKIANSSTLQSTSLVVMVNDIHDPRIIDLLLAGAYAVVDISKGFTRLIEKLRHMVLNEDDDQQTIIQKLVHYKTAGARPKISIPIQLTTKEKLILRLLTKGIHLKRIAVETGTTYHTVRTHLKHIYKKLGVTSASGAVIKAISMEL